MFSTLDKTADSYWIAMALVLFALGKHSSQSHAVVDVTHFRKCGRNRNPPSATKFLRTKPQVAEA